MRSLTTVLVTAVVSAVAATGCSSDDERDLARPEYREPDVPFQPGTRRWPEEEETRPSAPEPDLAPPPSAGESGAAADEPGAGEDGPGETADIGAGAEDGGLDGGAGADTGDGVGDGEVPVFARPDPELFGPLPSADRDVADSTGAGDGADIGPGADGGAPPAPLPPPALPLPPPSAPTEANGEGLLEEAPLLPPPPVVLPPLPPPAANGQGPSREEPEPPPPPLHPFPPLLPPPTEATGPGAAGDRDETDLAQAETGPGPPGPAAPSDPGAPPPDADAVAPPGPDEPAGPADEGRAAVVRALGLAAFLALVAGAVGAALGGALGTGRRERAESREVTVAEARRR